MLNLKNYYDLKYNWLMEQLDEPPVYFIKAQFRNTTSGAVRMFVRKLHLKKNLENEELEKFLKLELEKMIAEKTHNGFYEFIPFEDAIYNFNYLRRKLETYQAKTFFSEKEKESHEMFLRLAMKKAQSSGRW